MVRLGQEWEIDIIWLGQWVNVLIHRKKNVFSKYQHCFLSVDLSVIFGFLTPNLITVPIFIKIYGTKLKIWTKICCQDFQDDNQEDEKRRIVVQTFNCNILETIWDRTLKFGTFTYLHNMLQISLKSEKVVFRHVPLWCGISQLEMTLFLEKTPLKIHNSVRTWYFDGKIKSFRKLMICFSYFCQKNCFPLGHGPMTPFLCKFDPKNNLYSPVQSLRHTLYMWDCSHYEMRNKQHLSCAFP